MWVECVGLGWWGLDQQWVLPQGLIQRTFPGTFFISPHSLNSTPTSPGNIEVFKGMPIEKLDLQQCKKLTGEWARKGVV